MAKQGFVYIVTNKRNGTVYTGVTSDLVKRVYEHKNDVLDGFSSKYGCKYLVYYEIYESIEDAISREKQIKAGSRKRKLALIEAENPEWKDLYETLL